MSKLSKLLSFNDYTGKPAPVKESTAPVELKKVKTVAKQPVKKTSVVKESAFAVGSDYKVKLTLDIPQSIVTDYINKVKKETNKDALANYTAEELAEEMVRYIVKTKLSIDNISPSLAVGDVTGAPQEEQELDSSTDEDEVTTEQEKDEDDPFKDETEEFDLPDEDDEEPMQVQKGSSKMDFQGTEVNLGEKENIELDSTQKK